MECPSSSVLGRPGFEMEDIAELGPNLGVNTSVDVEEEEDVDMNASWGLNNMTAHYTEQNVAMDLEIHSRACPLLHHHHHRLHKQPARGLRRCPQQEHDEHDQPLNPQPCGESEIQLPKLERQTRTLNESELM